MPCNPWQIDFLECLEQEALEAERKKKIAEAMLAGAVTVITNTRIAHQSIEYNIASLTTNVKATLISMRNDGMFAWTTQQLQDWLDAQP